MMPLSKHSDSEQSCFLLILTSSFLKKNLFSPKYFLFAVKKILIFFLNTLDEAPQVFNCIHLQNK